jgi:hypothetical protein
VAHPQDLIQQTLGSARLDGFTDPDPAFVALLEAYASGAIDRTSFHARLPEIIAAAVERDRPRP